MSSTSFKNKLICALFYAALFMPLLIWIPIIWLVVANVQRKPMPDFFKYHCYQAVLFNMIAHFLPQVLSLLLDFTANLLSIMVIFDNTIVLLKSFNIWFLSIYFIAIKLVALYAIIWALRGKYTYIPPISQAVNLLLR